MMIGKIPIDKSDEEYKKYIQTHDIHFNGKYHAAFLLIISGDLKEIFLVKHKISGMWMIPGGGIDMRGTGGGYLYSSDESPLQCAIGEFTEETQHELDNSFIQKKIKKKYCPNFTGLGNVSGKISKEGYYLDGTKYRILWKYIIYYTVLNESEMFLFNPKEFNEMGIETSQCAWVPIDLVLEKKINVSDKVGDSIEKINDIIGNKNETLLDIG